MAQQPNPPDPFLKVTDVLIEEVVRLDDALQKIGLEGLSPGKYANEFRKELRTLKISFPTTNLKTVQQLESLGHASARLFTELGKLTGISSDQINSLFEFQSDLGVEVQVYRDSYNPNLAVEQVNELKTELAENFELIRPVLEDVISEVTRSVNVQSVENGRYTNLTVISTLLSGATASVLQIVGSSFQSGDSGLAIAVNACLFSSLVVSMASAAQSLLAISWIQTIVKQSTTRKSNKVYAWLLRQGPLISLLVAGALFVTGLILFMFASHQHRVTSFVTTCFAGLLTLIILILAVVLPWNHWKAIQLLERNFVTDTNGLMAVVAQVK